MVVAGKMVVPVAAMGTKIVVVKSEGIAVVEGIERFVVVAGGTAVVGVVVEFVKEVVVEIGMC